MIVLGVWLVVTFAVSAAKKRFIRYHWTEAVYDPINMKAVTMFEAKHPDVEVRRRFLPDADQPNVIRTVLAAKGSIDSFALDNGQSVAFFTGGAMVAIETLVASGKANTMGSPSNCP